MLKQMLEENGIIAALVTLGFPVADMFSEVDENADKLYSSYTWVKSECHVPGIDMEYVINAIPADFSKYAWEEWYATGGTLIHHILCESKWEECTDEAAIPADDKDHPQSITGKKWYYFEDRDLRPFFARKVK